MEAAVQGDRRAALLALSVHPLVRQVAMLEPLLDEILKENRDFLPQFFD